MRKYDKKNKSVFLQCHCVTPSFLFSQIKKYPCYTNPKAATSAGVASCQSQNHNPLTRKSSFICIKALQVRTGGRLGNATNQLVEAKRK